MVNILEREHLHSFMVRFDMDNMIKSNMYTTLEANVY